MTDATDPQPALATRLTGTLLLSALLRRTAVDGAGQGLGKLIDIIVRLREDDYPAVTGLVAEIGGRELFIPATEILAWDHQRLELASARLDLRQFERRPGEVLLRGDVLGHRLVDIEQPGMVTAHDVQISHTEDGWVVTAVDIHPRGVLRRRIRGRTLGKSQEDQSDHGRQGRDGPFRRCCHGPVGDQHLHG